ncbi:hypothetical protein TPHA_0O01310 [Tetrapisispora phaffii CBS 4417]|uniref:AB hydrolase-1 domain-containing protein n=1 Tax=Tetrapisispora phaffii (strain ATCC 24235 / CBS 4417 / NBRC 1672 / NRRL Y-8282 / UCD 70-5) TaxID=1071381 RepID=G8C1S1_TETPH|nr:hypothetical protein TPHA_0O01310 [Tetrapisispora phaffii CBS 4417]CCE66099.1 hypothetical protein TPHA_0O01310 [Tetrapisispora phaffii CBS 4417]
MHRYLKELLDNLRTIKLREKVIDFSGSNLNLIEKPSRLTSPSIPNAAAAPTASTAPTALSLFELIKQFPRLFPRSFMKSFQDYKQFHSDVENFQVRLLETLPYFPDPSNGIYSKITNTIVDDEGSSINEFVVYPSNISVPSEKLKHLIFVHGYGAGLGFFLKNLENIKLLNDEWCVHAIDLPGYGFSTRAKFPFQVGKHRHDQVNEWFHSRIRNWMHQRNLLQHSQNNFLIAHSLGAYLMALYVDKHPNDLQKILMCSPAGIGDSMNLKKKTPAWWFEKLWERNISPFTLVRSSSYIGSKLTSGWTYRRFSSLLSQNNLKQFEALHKYTYSIFNQRGSGEYLLNFALKCGGGPRYPLEKTLFMNNDKGISKSSTEWIWAYGDNDWMDKNGGIRVSEILTKQLKKRSEVYIVPRAGHHLYFDNHQFFNDLILKEMECMK